MSNLQNTSVENAAVVPAKQTVIPSIVTVDTKSFTRELEWTARFVEKKSKIPILANVAIRSVSGELQFVGTDLETGGTTSVEAHGDDFAVTIPAHLALKYLKKVSEPEVRLIAEGEKLTIKHGEDSEATIEGMSVESFPELPAMPNSLIALSGLADALPRVIMAISAEESRFTLNGALLEIRDGARMVSTDGHRLSVVDIQADSTDPVRAIVPRFALNEINRLGEDSVLFSADESHVFFSTGKRTVISRKLTGNFPDWERVMPKDYPNVATIDADGLRKHGERVALFCDERSHAMQFTLADSKLTISSMSCGSGKAKASIATTWEVPTWTSGFNWEYVLDFLKMAPKTAFDLKFSTEDMEKNGGNARAAVFTLPGWQYVVMPMRV
jgi:DNA polymerase-3 subunit beta